MPVCLQEKNPGGLEVLNPQPADFSTCTYVVPSGSEFSLFFGGIDPDFVFFVFSAMLLLFGVGLGVGFLASVVRKGRRL